MELYLGVGGGESRSWGRPGTSDERDAWKQKRTGGLACSSGRPGHETQDLSEALEGAWRKGNACTFTVTVLFFQQDCIWNLELIAVLWIIIVVIFTWQCSAAAVYLVLCTLHTHSHTTIFEMTYYVSSGTLNSTNSTQPFYDHFPGCLGGFPKVNQEIFDDCWKSTFHRLDVLSEAQLTVSKKCII